MVNATLCATINHLFLTLWLPLVSVSYFKFGLRLLFLLVESGGHFVTFIVVIKLTERLRGHLVTRNEVSMHHIESNSAHISYLGKLLGMHCSSFQFPQLLDTTGCLGNRISSTKASCCCLHWGTHLASRWMNHTYDTRRPSYSWNVTNKINK